MPSLKDLKNRISSVKSTRKITKAMQMVAAAKLRRAQDAAEQARPYTERFNAVMGALAASSGDNANGPRLLAGTGSDKTHLLVVLTADMVLQRPPGLWAALTVALAHNLKSRGPRQREANFALEWTSVALALLGMTAIYQIVKLLLIIPPMAWTLAITQLVATVAIYPLAVGLSVAIFGRGTVGEADRTGQGL